ncbi:hypothetical protein [Sphingobacterium wenxiniae]|uniref:hypothetical protein n=1 Tax=Sphingobacterium wenxiniae TaxID=683125 RepID=UPI001BAF4B3A|nr:hypothetical protein [Sphingobacterium wenxiniae]
MQLTVELVDMTYYSVYGYIVMLWKAIVHEVLFILIGNKYIHSALLYVVERSM